MDTEESASKPKPQKKLEDYLKLPKPIDLSAEQRRKKGNKAAKNIEKRPWRQKGETKDFDPNKLRLPLLKGYDDYDRELKALLGDDRDKFLNMMDAANMNGKLKPITCEELDSAKDFTSPAQETQAFEDYNKGAAKAAETSALDDLDEQQKEQIAKFCRPQFLHQLGEDDLGFSFNVIGIFGEPEERPDAGIYTCMVSLAPPAEPYKPKGCNSMLYAHHFFKPDWVQTSPKQFVFREVDDYQISGKIFKPNKHSGLLFDIKRFDFKTRKL